MEEQMTDAKAQKCGTCGGTGKFWSESQGGFVPHFACNGTGLTPPQDEYRYKPKMAPPGMGEVKRWDVWNETLQMTPHTGTRINRDDSYWTVVVLASAFDAEVRAGQLLRKGLANLIDSQDADLAAARAEIARLESRVYDQSTPEAVIRCRNAELLDERQRHLDEIAALRVGLAAAEKDAGRYRCLRERAIGFECDPRHEGIVFSLPLNNTSLAPESVDKAVDAAIQQGSTKGTANEK